MNAIKRMSNSPFKLFRVLMAMAVIGVPSTSYGQVTSANGNFTATTPSNLSLQAGATPTTRLTILNSNGFVGINTTAPSDWLHVNGNVRANQFNTVNGVFNTTAAATNMSFNINGTNRMTLLAANGNFGIGTAAPADLLHVNGNLRGTQLNLTGGILNTTASTTDLSFRTNNTARMTILGYNGYVGIGTNSPANQLQIGPSPNGWGGNDLVVANGNGGLAIGTDATETYLVGTKDISIKPGNGVQSIYAKSNGNVGIGISAPGGKLHVNGSVYVGNNDGSAPYRVSIGGSYGDYGSIGYGYKYTDLGGHTYLGTEWASQLKFDAGGFDFKGATIGTAGASVNFSSLMKIDNNGNVGIGTSTPNPAYKLDVAGTINATNILVNGQPISGGTSSWANIGTDINFLTGSVGIGKAPAAGNKLDVEGNVNSTGIFLNSNPGLGDPTFTTRSAGTKFVLSPSLTSAAADYAFGTSANTLWSSVNTTSSSFKWFGGTTLAATLTGGGNLTLGSGGSGSLKARNVIPSSINLTSSGATTTLTAASHYYQNSTVAQTITLPVVTTLSNGHQFFIKNSSTQPVTVQTSAGTAVQVMAANATLELTCINTGGGTGTASWQWVYNTNTAGSPATSQWTTTGSNISYAAGNVGIGTNAPGAKLDVGAFIPNGALGSVLGRLQEGNSTGVGTFLGVRGYDTQPTNVKSFAIEHSFYGSINSSVNFFRGGGNTGGFLTFNTDANTEQVRITNTGNVGIGTTSPSEKLEVNGNVNVGLSTGATTGYGSRLNLRGLIDDGDPIWMSRYNAGPNQTELRVNIGDDAGGEDAFTVGNFFYGDGQWKTFMKVQNNGNVGIGTATPNFKLDVNGTIHTKEVKVDLIGWPDYVFEKDYKLMSLEETKVYIDANKHLPEMPSAQEVEKNGANLGEMNMLLLKKVEELTLHLIDQQNKVKEQEQRIKILEKRLEK